MIERGEAPYNWACGILKREIENGTYGSFTATMQDGLIVGVKVERSEKPPMRESPLAPRRKTS